MSDPASRPISQGVQVEESSKAVEGSLTSTTKDDESAGKSKSSEEEKKDDAVITNASASVSLGLVQQLQAQVAELALQVETREKELKATNRVKVHLQRENRRLQELSQRGHDNNNTDVTNAVPSKQSPSKKTLTPQQEDELREEPVHVDALQMRLRDIKPKTAKDYMLLLQERESQLQKLTVKAGLQKKQLRKHEDYIASMKSPQQVLEHVEQLQQALAQARLDQMQQLDDLLKLVTPHNMTSISLDDDDDDSETNGRGVWDELEGNRSSSALFVHAKIQSKYDELKHTLKEFLAHASPEQITENTQRVNRLEDQVELLHSQLSAIERQAFNKDTKLLAVEQELADTKLAHEQLQQRLGVFLAADSNRNDPDSLQQLYAQTQQLEQERDHAIHKHVQAQEAFMEAQQTIEMLQLQIEKQARSGSISGSGAMMSHGVGLFKKSSTSSRGSGAVVGGSMVGGTPRARMPPSIIPPASPMHRHSTTSATCTPQSAEDLRRRASELLSQAESAHRIGGSLRGERTSRSRPSQSVSNPHATPKTAAASSSTTNGGSWAGLGGSLRGERSARSRGGGAFGDHDTFGMPNKSGDTHHTNDELGTDSERGGTWGSRLRNFKRSLMEERSA